MPAIRQVLIKRFQAPANIPLSHETKTHIAPEKNPSTKLSILSSHSPQSRFSTNLTKTRIPFVSLPSDV